MTSLVTERHNMQRLYLFFILSFFLMASFGCGFTKSLIKKEEIKTSGLKKRVMVFPPLDRAGVGSIRAAEITADLVGLLDESSHLLVYEASNEMSRSLVNSSPTLGTLNPDRELLKKAEDLGMNALITWIFSPPETGVKKTGIWPFRKSCKTYNISLVLNVMDIASKTLILSKRESETVSFTPDQLEEHNKKEILDQAAGEAAPLILERLASSVITSLEQTPWFGKILLITEHNTIIINAGQDVGIAPGQLFSVFLVGDSISCKNDKSFCLLGKKAGKIKMVSIMERHSLATRVSGGPFSVGQVVKVEP